MCWPSSKSVVQVTPLLVTVNSSQGFRRWCENLGHAESCNTVTTILSTDHLVPDSWHCYKYPSHSNSVVQGSRDRFRCERHTCHPLQFTLRLRHYSNYVESESTGTYTNPGTMVPGVQAPVPVPLLLLLLPYLLPSLPFVEVPGYQYLLWNLHHSPPRQDCCPHYCEIELISGDQRHCSHLPAANSR